MKIESITLRENQMRLKAPFETSFGVSHQRRILLVELIADGEQWMAMIQSRNLSAHTYNQAVAEQLMEAIAERYFPLFVELQSEMEKHLA